MPSSWLFPATNSMYPMPIHQRAYIAYVSYFWAFVVFEVCFLFYKRGGTQLDQNVQDELPSWNVYWNYCGILCFWLRNFLEVLVLKGLGLPYYDNRDMIRTIFPTIIQFVAFNEDSLEIQTTISVLLLANRAVSVNWYSNCTFIASALQVTIILNLMLLTRCFQKWECLSNPRNKEMPSKCRGDLKAFLKVFNIRYLVKLVPGIDHL